MDDDPHVLKPNQTADTILEHLSRATDYISIPLCATAIFADVLLITAILKHKRLKNRNNFFICNFAAFHILYILSTPCFYVILDLFYEGQLVVNWFCVWIRVENLGIGLSLTFSAGYGIDTLLEQRKLSWWSKYNQRYCYVFSFFYFLHFLVYVISASICLKSGMVNNFNFYSLTIYYIILFGLVLYGYTLKKPSHFSVQVSLMVLLIWLPLYIWYNLINIFRDVRKIETVLWYTAFLPEYLAYTCSIAVVWKLWKSNSHFKVAFKKLLRIHVSNLEYDALNTNETST